ASATRPARAASETGPARAAAAPGPARPQPEIRLASTSHGHVAYADWGADPRRGGVNEDGCGSATRPTLVVLWGVMSNLEVALDEPGARALLDRLAARYRVVMLDRRGSGLAERVGVSPDLESAAEDIVATLDAIGVRRAWLFGSSVGGTLALAFALRHPGRTAGLLLWGTSPVGRWREDWPYALPASKLDDWVAAFTEPARYHESLRVMAPSAADDPAMQRWYARLLRNSCTPRGTAALLRAYQAMDLRPQLAQIGVPTLVLQRRGDRIVPLEAGRRLAQAIPQARFQALDGDDHFLWLGETAVLEQAVQRFVDAHDREGAGAQALAA
ncbi:MAG: alpha/beta hydrolase, partial [Rubrivivax sp.]|nr:alpha/beta hydrolase [Rubrivivax sp.]